jgi:hypothetical protein
VRSWQTQGRAGCSIRSGPRETDGDGSVELAARRASAAAALELDRVAFQFPSDDEIERALTAGWV